MSVTIANTTANVTGKTVLLAERDFTVTGAYSFNRSPSAPFIVQAGSASVANLDADKLDGLDSLQFAKLATNETITGIWSFGNVATFNSVITSTFGQIGFPATQNPSVAVNTLDDYEEGTWTPVIGGSGGTSGQTYSVQSGTYVKIGKQVTAWFDVTLSTLGTVTTSAQIQGLPFTVENANATSGGSLPFWANTTAAYIFMSVVPVGNTTTANLYGNTAGVTSTAAVVQAGLANTTRLLGMVTYRATT